MSAFLECPCCGESDCVPEGPATDSRPGLPTWWDDQTSRCPDCGCIVGVEISDDYDGDARAWAIIVEGCVEYHTVFDD